MKKRCSLAAAMLCLSLLAAYASAESLSLADALRSALHNHPDLQAYSLKGQVATAEIATAELGPPAQINLEIENLAHSKTSDTVELTLTFSSLIERKGQRHARKAIATAHQQRLADEQRVAALDVLARVNQAFVELLAAQARQELAEEAERVSAAALTAVERMARAGSVAVTDVLRARVALEKHRIAKAGAQHKVTAQAQALSFAMGAVHEVIRANGDFWSLSTTPPLAELIVKARNNPDLELLAADLRVRDAELTSADLSAKTNVEWQAGVRYLQEADATALVFGVSMPLGAASRSRGTVAKLRAERDISALTVVNAEAVMTRRVRQMYSAYIQAFTEATAIRGQVLPLIEEWVKEATSNNRQGRLDALSVLQAQQELIDARASLIESTLAAHLALIELDRLTASLEAIP